MSFWNGVNARSPSDQSSGSEQHETGQTDQTSFTATEMSSSTRQACHDETAMHIRESLTRTCPSTQGDASGRGFDGRHDRGDPTRPDAHRKLELLEEVRKTFGIGMLQFEVDQSTPGNRGSRRMW